MTEILAFGVLGIIVIAAADVLAPKLRTASPLILVLIGFGLSLVPDIGHVQIDPDLILEGILPPLLYASAVSMPTMSFRREFGAISGLSVVLVLVTALGLGVLFALLLPGVGFAWGVALGAVLSPTDAVATSIIRGGGVPRRAVVLLEGEGLLNDATALVLLRTAIVAGAATFSLWGAITAFAWAILSAVLIGTLAAVLVLKVRRRLQDPTLDTLIGFTAPFIASIPTELLGGSGLVAAVIAGLVTGAWAPRVIPARHRMSNSVNWATVNLVLESAVFLLMGVQLTGIVQGVIHEEGGLLGPIAIALLALLGTLLVRALFAVPLLRGLSRRAERSVQVQPHLEAWQRRFEQHDPSTIARILGGDRNGRGSRRAKVVGRNPERLATRVRRSLADIDYLLAHPLGRREGAIVVWAGMRGAVTVAAAQTLPPETPHRELLIFLAFAVATASLLLQGSTIGALAGRLFPAADPEEEASLLAERDQLRELTAQAAEEIAQEHAAAGPSPGPDEHALRIEQLEAARTILLDARADGTFDADVLSEALLRVDTEQIALETTTG